MSKKVKGQKLDLASFVGSNPSMNLPTAPDPSRQRRDVRKNRDEEGRGYENRDKFDKRDNGQNWSRSTRTDEFGGQNNVDDQPWRKNISKTHDEKVERVKLNLLPRTGTVPSVQESESQEDKWSKVFKSETSRNRFNNSSKQSQDDVDDNKSSKTGMQTTVFKRGPRDEISSFSLPTAPRSVVTTPAAKVAAPIATVTKDNSLNELKAAKAQQRLEADRKAKELKEQQRLDDIATAVKEKELSDLAYESAVLLLATGLKGSSLLFHYKEKQLSTSGSMLLKAILLKQEDMQSPWWHKSEYGEILHFLFQNSSADQISALYVVQEYCHSKQFPKVEVKGVSRRLIEVYFGNLLSSDLVDLEGFVSWADDDGLRSESSVGRMDSIVHTTNFIQSVRQALLATDEASEEEDEVDAPRETVK